VAPHFQCCQINPRKRRRVHSASAVNTVGGLAEPEVAEPTIQVTRQLGHGGLEVGAAFLGDFADSVLGFRQGLRRDASLRVFTPREAEPEELALPGSGHRAFDAINLQLQFALDELD
jgi:hypothetical protein